MNISRFIHQRTVALSPSATLRDAAKAMRMSRLSCLPVVRGTSVVGVVTERDLVKAMAISDRACEALVAHYMSSAVTVSRDEDIPRAVAKMLASGCADMPVVEDGSLIGTVSSRELLAAEAQLQGVSV